ncbi:hypothetical protein [Chondromyces crocatus]|uniref:Uncharacterized protein n=1 Tax=Chondromyces crocatus TaxID=52 RepID=A0A0K1ESD7_CHOCO|nr:hypothetical protein [Chondromyces crocatus]AKT43533.1 uncharacterized protein CMC5_077650 [Chondromyces crocatus]
MNPVRWTLRRACLTATSLLVAVAVPALVYAQPDVPADEPEPPPPAISDDAPAPPPPPGSAGASDPGAPPAPAAPSPAGAAAERTWVSCTEHVPSGATRPVIQETFPATGFSGYAAPLTIVVTHGKGETVLPEGFKLQRASDAARGLTEAGFVIPEADAGAGPTIARPAPGSPEERVTTTVIVPFVALPPKPGRNLMELPPVPVAIARASGEVVTVCTRPHRILIEDPIANEVDPKVKPNPEPRPQREDWAFARHAALAALAGAVLALLLAWLIRRWRQRPKVVHVPPPKLPWIAAMEELSALRRSSLLAEGHTDEFFDRVSDCVRRYLGARYGFDGLETTSDEMRSLLRRVRPPVLVLPEIGEFLSDCDLVKFARVQPTEQDCRDALERGEQIIRRTIPQQAAPSAGNAAPPAGASGGSSTSDEVSS